MLLGCGHRVFFPLSVGITWSWFTAWSTVMFLFCISNKRKAARIRCSEAPPPSWTYVDTPLPWALADWFLASDWLCRELGLDELQNHCEQMRSKLRFPEQDPCYLAMAGTPLFTDTAQDMLHHYIR